MNLNLIQTKDYLLLIDEEAEIKNKDILYNEIFGVYESEANGAVKSHYKIIAYYPLTKEVEELDLPLLPNPFENTLNIEHLAEEQADEKCMQDSSLDYTGFYKGFIEGHKAAQSKQFSLEDMKKAIEMARSGSNGLVTLKDFLTPDYSEEEIIQSLSTQQLPKEFVPECEKEIIGQVSGTVYVDKKLKTTINSEGKQELVGTYKY